MKNYRYLIKKIFKNNKDNIAVKHNNEFFELLLKFRALFEPIS